MQVRFTKLSDARHGLEIVRRDGTREAVELETRSLLLHDLVHFALESEAGLEQGFYGLLASGTPLARLNQREAPPASEQLALIETLVGPAQALVNTQMSPEAYLAHARSLAPELVDAQLVERLLERVRQLRGHWRATPYGASMELDWPLKSGA